MAEKIENANQGITVWAENESQSYNPTGKNGFWTFMIIRPQNLTRYAYATAYEQNTGKVYVYSNYVNSWDNGFPN